MYERYVYDTSFDIIRIEIQIRFPYEIWIETIKWFIKIILSCRQMHNECKISTNISGYYFISISLFVHEYKCTYRD